MRALLGRQRLLLYLTLIAGPALVLLGLSIHSVSRQVEALDTLRRANARLRAEQVEHTLAESLRQLAATALRDESFAFLEAAVDHPSGTDPSAADAAARKIVARHRVARHVFLADRNGIKWPAAYAPLQGFDRASSGPPGTSGHVRAFAAAEDIELRLGEPARAAVVYERLARRDVAPVFRALALSRAARSHGRAGHAAEAVEAWQRLAQGYGDRTDAYGQPYGLLALVALAESGAADVVTPAVLDRAYRELAEGRWPLSADQADYFLGEFERLLHRTTAARPRTEFLSAGDLARALEERFAPRLTLAAGETHAVPAGRDGRFVLHYTPGRVMGRFIGIAVNTPWANAELRQSVLRQLGRPGGPGSSAEPLATSPRISMERQVVIFAVTTMVVVAALAVGLVLLVRDVSREAQLNQLRARFVSGVSHDLKTPLTVVKLYAESLADDEEPPPEERQRFYQIILRESDRLTRMIDRVLTFARAGTTTRRYTFVTGSVVPVITAALDQYGPYLRQRGFETRVQVEEPFPDTRLDEDAVREALINLIDNAVKYSPQPHVIDIRAFTKDGGAVVTVHDQGPGVPPAEQARIFQPFYRGNAAIDQGGHGLGLALVSEVMKAHGGAVELETGAGAGSCFRLVFPSVG